MIIVIAGLGLIGASYAEGLHAKGHTIYAWNRSEATLQKAIDLGFVQPGPIEETLKSADVLILALYPKHNTWFIREHRAFLPPGLIITDVSGTKTKMMDEIETILPEGVFYTSHHPMAGKETSGFDVRDPLIFKRANAIIVKGPASGPSDVLVLHGLLKDLEFGRILETDRQTHDALIAFTSQLTHVLAVTLVQSDHFDETAKATGDSYRDLTRIAKINEIMWTDLFLMNKEALLDQIERFEEKLAEIKLMIKEEDRPALIETLRTAKEKRLTFDNIKDEDI
ncbi:MAG: prephenate dehydrogenase [Acholeplasmataceae bacterium]|nr:prephenate dehydrogenase [Acholeplasmataceae bacterium]